MTTDQTLHLLAVLAWPTVAVIASIAFILGMRIVSDIVDDCIRCADRWRKDLNSYHGYWSAVFCERWQDDRHGGALRETCERSLLTILAANGGFPSAEGDDVGRQLVREIRKMYAELASPTPAPSRAPGRQPDQPGDQTDPLDPDEVFADFDEDDDRPLGDMADNAESADEN